MMAHRLANIYPHLIHVEKTAFTNPYYKMNSQMYGPKYYNYSNNYSVHVYCEKFFFIPSNEDELRGYNCTLGNIMRHVLYGSPQLLDFEHVRNGYQKNIKVSQWCAV